MGGAATRLCDPDLGRGEFAVAALIFIVTLLIYVVSPITTSSDAMFAMHVAASFYKGLFGELSPWLPVIKTAPAFQINGMPYQIAVTATGVYSHFPIGTPLLAVPYLAANQALGGHLLGILDHSIAPWHDHFAASAISAAAVPMLYLAMRRRDASVTAALLATTAFALGTSLWSTASRGLWQQGPLMLCYATAFFFLAHKPIRVRDAAAAGFALGYAILIRQSSGLLLIFVALALVTQWRIAAALLLGAIPPILVMIAYNLHAFGWIGNPYVSDYLQHARGSLTGLAGLVASPQRGLFVFSPILLFAVYGFVHLVRRGRAAPLDWAFIAYPICLWIFVSFWPDWWGGYAYGSRELSETSPFLILYVAVAWDALAAAPRQRAWPAMAAFIVLLAVSCAIHARGATDWDVWRWNHRPGLEARLWDWSDLQILYATGRTDVPTLENSRPSSVLNPMPPP